MKASNSPLSGSSPLARGTPLQLTMQQVNFRFIPAGAGNTPRTATNAAKPTVHPRWRGEHSTAEDGPTGRSVSSQLARVTLIKPVHGAQWVRFIPAGAGNTSSMFQTFTVIAVHPRWRGEHSVTRHPVQYRNGSSPLARGTRAFLAGTSRQERFIPAGAGNTYARPARRRLVPVHPRWRGEHS